MLSLKVTVTILCFVIKVIRCDVLPSKNVEKIYYDLKSNLPFPMAAYHDKRIGFRNRNGCSCQDLTCGCCAGINIQQFNFDQSGCMNFTYDPNDFSLTMDMLMNGNSIYRNTVSAKNPPPLCMPVPIPYLPSVDFCVRLFDIFMPGQNLHMCMDFETRIQKAPVFVLHFDCMRMGADGVALVKPGDNGGLPQPTEPPQVDSDVYNPITEIIKLKTNSTK